jgi:hypothetical protein
MISVRVYDTLKRSYSQFGLVLYLVMRVNVSA